MTEHLWSTILSSGRVDGPHRAGETDLSHAVRVDLARKYGARLLPSFPGVSSKHVGLSDMFMSTHGAGNFIVTEEDEVRWFDLSRELETTLTVLDSTGEGNLWDKQVFLGMMLGMMTVMERYIARCSSGVLGLLTDFFATCGVAEHEMFCEVMDGHMSRLEDEDFVRLKHDRPVLERYHRKLLTTLAAGLAANCHSTLERKMAIAPDADILYETGMDETLMVGFPERWWETAVFEFGHRELATFGACPEHVCDIVQVGT